MQEISDSLQILEDCAFNSPQRAEAAKDVFELLATPKGQHLLQQQPSFRKIARERLRHVGASPLFKPYFKDLRARVFPGETFQPAAASLPVF